MKTKVSAAVLLIIMLLSFTACGTITPSASPDAPGSTASPDIPSETPKPDFPEYPDETVKLTDLGGYTIVYPSYYDEYRMNEVYILRDTIKKVTGAELKIISDDEAKCEHEIILASSDRQNGVEESIEMFESGLDYVVGALNGNIILGGNNFYADMRAVYDFINNYLGYNDIDNIYSEPKSEISGVNLNIYKEPIFTLMGSNFSVSPYTEQYAVRDMHEAHFNLTLIDIGLYNSEQIRDFVKWCARYEIFIMMRGIQYVDVYADCPIIWGHVIMDEPALSMFASCSQACAEYIEKYSQYGWQPYVNFTGFDYVFEMLEAFPQLFESVPVVSFDRYFERSLIDNVYMKETNLLHVYELARERSVNTGKDLWTYIDAYNIVNRSKNSSKLFRWSSYISLSFGAKGILYFQYGDASPNYTAEGDWTNGSLANWDFSKTEAWYDAKRCNEELLALAEILNEYEYVGAYVHNTSFKQFYNTFIENPYTEYDSIVADIKKPTLAMPYLFGFYDKKDNGNSHAITLLSLESLDELKYGENEPEYAQIKLNGENIKFYHEGVLQDIEPDDDGYYSIDVSNGSCWFITMD